MFKLVLLQVMLLLLRCRLRFAEPRLPGQRQSGDREGQLQP